MSFDSDFLQSPAADEDGSDAWTTRHPLSSIIQVPHVSGMWGDPSVHNNLVPHAKRGLRLESKRVDEIYYGPSRGWVIQEGTKEAASSKKDEIFAEYAFLVWRRVKPSDNLMHPPSIETAIDLKSEYLKNVCEEVIGNSMGISWDERPLRVDPKVFVAYLPRLRLKATEIDSREGKSQTELTTLDHLSFFINFIDEEYSELIQTISRYLARGEITYDLLWAILLSRTPMYTECAITSEPRLTWLVQANQEGSAYRLRSQAVDCVTDLRTAETPQSGLAELDIASIELFRGAVRIDTLPSHPLEYHKDAGRLMAKLLERGEKWEDLQGIRHVHYTGEAYYAINCGSYGKTYIDGRIMVDRGLYEEMSGQIPPPPRLSADLDLKETKRITVGTKGEMPLRDAVLPFTSPVVYGFSLQEKRWLIFNVEQVRDIEWNEELIDELVLPDGKKELIRALAIEGTTHGTRTDQHPWEGNGHAVVIALHGGPGVGKTLTVEAMAEHTMRPLYVVGCLELGTTPESFEKELKRIFKICARWNAVVLMDNAEMFLEDRSLSNVNAEQSAMVAIFLRQLEHFDGVLILTTNRIHSFDEAVLSQAQFCLRYEDLSTDAKRQIWTAFIDRARASRASSFFDNSGITDERLTELAGLRMNGRQIKNVVRTAFAIAKDRREVLSYEHIVEVLG